MELYRDNIDRLISAATGDRPSGGFDLVVLGSGMGGLLEGEEFDPILAVAEPRVAGHPMRGGVATVDNGRRIVIAGRGHHYEGYRPAEALLTEFLDAEPTRLLLLSAAGGIRPSLTPGDLVLHVDYLSIQPFRGMCPYPPRDRSRTQWYVPPSREVDRLTTAARQNGLALKAGTYAWVAGPSYETRAEIRMLREAGADVVGMSIYHEVAEAVSRGVPVTSLSLVTNVLSDTGRRTLDHNEVTAASFDGLEAIRRMVACW